MREMREITSGATHVKKRSGMEVIMTREQAKQNLISIGIEEPSDEQVTNYLNQVNGESKKEKEKAEKYKADADEAAKLRTKLEELEAGNLSEVEKANKERDTALNSVADLQKQIRSMEMRTKFTEKGITGEAADKLIKSIEDGIFDIETLGVIISEKETAAAQAKEKEIADNSANPGGVKTGTEDDKKTEAEKFAEIMVKENASDEKGATDIIDAYK